MKKLLFILFALSISLSGVCQKEHVQNVYKSQYFDKGELKNPKVSIVYIGNIINLNGIGAFVHFKNRISVYGNIQAGKTNSDFKELWTNYDSENSYTETEITQVRNGCMCNDGTTSNATGSGACSGHGGVNYWTYTNMSYSYTISPPTINTSSSIIKQRTLNLGVSINLLEDYSAHALRCYFGIGFFEGITEVTTVSSTSGLYKKETIKKYQVTEKHKNFNGGIQYEMKETHFSIGFGFQTYPKTFNISIGTCL